MVPFEAARSSALTAALTSSADVASAPVTAARAFFSAVRSSLLAARLRSVLLMRWRLRLTADAWLAMWALLGRLLRRRLGVGGLRVVALGVDGERRRAVRALVALAPRAAR